MNDIPWCNSVNTLWLQISQKIVTADSSRGITLLQVSQYLIRKYSLLWTIQMCASLFLKKGRNTYKDRPHILEFLTAFQKCCVHSPSTYWYVEIQVTQACSLFCKENRQLTGGERWEGQGIPLHDGEGMKSCVQFLQVWSSYLYHHD